ncbi:MAG: Asp-tRNA(Asn)/Glu-tRNA(Gln) amidotransferase subunit GatC [Phycisphaerales bacterium]|nr:Asp-tRNA(Asn)/Glu-tRNA(Gln) amidotransferase subunit GatC [Phycisphaerales bacterium]
MSERPRSMLSEEAVRKVARLSRLAIDESQIPRYADQLSSILQHIERIQELDVEGVEPMAHPLPLNNRLDDDVPNEGMPIEDLLKNAPSVRDDYISVPKVLGEGSS